MDIEEEAEDSIAEDEATTGALEAPAPRPISSSTIMSGPPAVSDFAVGEAIGAIEDIMATADADEAAAAVVEVIEPEADGASAAGRAYTPLDETRSAGSR